MQIRLMIGCTAQRAASLVADAVSAHARDARDVLEIQCKPVAIEDACKVAATLRPDVALLDFHAGLHMLPALKRASPPTRPLLLLHESCTGTDLVDAVRLGAVGCVPRTSRPEHFAKAVRTAFAGGTWFGRGVLLQALQSQIHVEPQQPELGHLTQREEEILQLIGRGLSNKEIGRRLEISDHTVKTHLHRVYSKLHQSGRFKAFLAQPHAPAAVHVAQTPAPETATARAVGEDY